VAHTGPHEILVFLVMMASFDKYSAGFGYHKNTKAYGERQPAATPTHAHVCVVKRASMHLRPRLLNLEMERAIGLDTHQLTEGWCWLFHGLVANIAIRGNFKQNLGQLPKLRWQNGGHGDVMVHGKYIMEKNRLQSLGDSPLRSYQLALVLPGTSYDHRTGIV
jgi:hypothetical protein